MRASVLPPSRSAMSRSTDRRSAASSTPTSSGTTSLVRTALSAARRPAIGSLGARPARHPASRLVLATRSVAERGAGAASAENSSSCSAAFADERICPSSRCATRRDLPRSACAKETVLDSSGRAFPAAWKALARTSSLILVDVFMLRNPSHFRHAKLDGPVGSLIFWLMDFDLKHHPDTRNKVLNLRKEICSFF